MGRQASGCPGIDSLSSGVQPTNKSSSGLLWDARGRVVAERLPGGVEVPHGGFAVRGGEVASEPRILR